MHSLAGKLAYLTLQSHVEVLALPLTCYVNLGKLLNLSEPQLCQNIEVTIIADAKGDYED